jgi:hypothetical protein
MLGKYARAALCSDKPPNTSSMSERPLSHGLGSRPYKGTFKLVLGNPGAGAEDQPSEDPPVEAAEALLDPPRHRPTRASLSLDPASKGGDGVRQFGVGAAHAPTTTA